MTCSVCIGYIDNLIAHYSSVDEVLYRSELEVAVGLRDIIAQSVSPAASRLRAIACYQTMQAALWHDMSTAGLMHLHEVLCEQMKPTVESFDTLQSALVDQMETFAAMDLERRLSDDVKNFDSALKLLVHRSSPYIETMLEVSGEMRRVLTCSHKRYDLENIGNSTAKALRTGGVESSRIEGILRMLISINEKETINVWNTIPEYLG